jgi:hypothetical protein
LELKIFVGTREKNKQKIDAFITSRNVVLSHDSVETFEVDNGVLDHNPIGAVLALEDLVAVTQTKDLVIL